MSFSKETIESLARLARLTLSEEEKTRFSDELGSILEYVGELNRVDTTHVSPMSGGTELESVFRSDDYVNDLLEGSEEELVKAAPQERDGYISVKNVFE